jgi:hypothetical protein
VGAVGFFRERNLSLSLSLYIKTLKALQHAFTKKKALQDGSLLGYPRHFFSHVRSILDEGLHRASCGASRASCGASQAFHRGGSRAFRGGPHRAILILPPRSVVLLCSPPRSPSPSQLRAPCPHPLPPPAWPLAPPPVPKSSTAVLDEMRGTKKKNASPPHCRRSGEATPRWTPPTTAPEPEAALRPAPSRTSIFKDFRSRRLAIFHAPTHGTLMRLRHSRLSSPEFRTLTVDSHLALQTSSISTRSAIQVSPCPCSASWPVKTGEMENGIGVELPRAPPTTDTTLIPQPAPPAPSRTQRGRGKEPHPVSESMWVCFVKKTSVPF